MKTAFLSSLSLGPLKQLESAKGSLYSGAGSLAPDALGHKARGRKRASNLLRSRLDANVKAQELGSPRANGTKGACKEQPQSARDSLVAQVVKVAGPDRGIFALNEFQRESIATALEVLERRNPTRAPVWELEAKLVGKWRLVYTDRMILGWRRTVLYLVPSAKPGLIHLGEVTQTICAPEETETPFRGRSIALSGRAENQVEFRIFGGLQGHYAVTATYGTDALDGKRVWVKGESSSLEPTQFASMMNEQRQQTLMELFDPTGYLDVTYLDDTYRIVRDDKGFVYLWERMPAAS